jgi:hypothetical protein
MTGLLQPFYQTARIRGKSCGIKIRFANCEVTIPSEMTILPPHITLIWAIYNKTDLVAVDK